MKAVIHSFLATIFFVAIMMTISSLLNIEKEYALFSFGMGLGTLWGYYWSYKICSEDNKKRKKKKKR